MKPYSILSIGGSIIIPKEGFNVPFLKSFRSMILRRVKNRERFILTVGGGATCRAYQQAAKKTVSSLTDIDIDWIGIHTTRFNAEFVRSLFKDVAYEHIIVNPKQKYRTRKPILIAAGYLPGHSTDTDAVHLADSYGAKELYNLSNISYVYDKDPNQYSDAKQIEDIDWKTFRNDIVGHTWVPGKSAPFDPIASAFAEKHKMTVRILNGTDLKEVQKALSGKRFRGTTIHP